MGEVSSTIAEAIRNRATSTSLVTYSFFWLAWHWQGVYTTLFTSEDKIYTKLGLLKNEYVSRYFFGYHGWETIFGFIWPLILTVIFIWPLQKFIIINAYKLEQKVKTDRRKIRLYENETIEKYKAELIDQRTARTRAETQETKATTEKIKAEKELSVATQKAAETNPEIAWAIDYEKFSHMRQYKLFGFIINSIYRWDGAIKEDYNHFSEKYGFEIPQDLLVYSDTNDLINLEQKGNKIALTDKGRYFVKRFTEEN